MGKHSKLINQVENHRKCLGCQRLQKILDTLPVGVILADSKGKFIQTNCLIHEILGGNASHLSKTYGYKEYKAWWTESETPVKAKDWAMTRAITSGETSIGEVFNIQRLDGTKGTIINSASPFVSNTGKVEGAVVVIQDATEQQLISDLIKLAVNDLSIEEFADKTLDTVLSMPFVNKRGTLYLVQEPETMHLMSYRGVNEKMLLKQTAVTECLCRKVDQNKQLVFTNGNQCSYLSALGITNHLCIPVVKGNSLLGVISVSLKENHLHSKVKKEYLTAIANTLASFIVRKRAEKELINHRDNLQHLIKERTAELQGEIQERRQLEEKFSIAFNASPSAMTISNKDGVYIDTNKSFQRITGYTKKEAVGKTDQNLCLWYDELQQKELLKKLAAKGFYNNYEAKLRTKTGQMRTILASLEIIVVNGEKHILNVFDDITDRKVSEDKIAELATIIEDSNDAIIGGNLEGVIRYWNKGAQELFGYSPEEVIGKSYSLLLPDFKDNELQEILQSILAGKNIKHFETVRVRKDGLTVNVSVTISPVRGTDEGIKGFSVIARDITEQKQFEKEMARLDRLNLIGQMAGGIGHEVRNPMTSVRGFLQLLSSKETDTKKIEYYDIMIEELDRANSIISEFLSLAKDRLVNLELSCLNSVINAIYPLIATDAVKQDIHIVIKNEDIPLIPLNEKEIRQLIINLVRNGVEAMPSGGQLVVGTCSDNDEVVLYVKDEGSGIQPEILDKLGHPFVTTKDSGTGLGLAVCYSIANKHNAKIDVKTGPSGTTFYVKFKLPKNKVYSKNAS